MSHETLSVEAVYELVARVLLANGCDEANASAIADTVGSAERDGCASHGLFRLPGYVKSLRSGAVDGRAQPTVERIAPAVLRVDGGLGYSPLAITTGRAPLAELAREQGIAAEAIVRAHHFAALWPEVEALAEQGLAALAFTCYMANVAPAGARVPFFGTNPMSFAWPRDERPPLVFDQASSLTARGEVMIAARDGHRMPEGAGIDRDGHPTTDPAAILEGAQLPFGGYKGSSIALMVELLAAGLVGQAFSYESTEADKGKGDVMPGGELIIAIDPSRFGDRDGWLAHSEAFLARLMALDGVRLPGDRRRANRERNRREGVRVPAVLMREIRALL